MTMRAVRLFGWLVVSVLSVAAANAQVTGNAERGETLGYTCMGCHGIPNYKNTYPTYSVPKLKGQHPEYLVVALKGYKNGERSHSTMHAHAASMSEQDMADVAAYLAGPPIKPAADAKPVGTPPKAVEVCVACHGTDGVGIVAEYPTLSGQHADYLARALSDYKRGNRKNAVMSSFASALSDADIKAVAAYYSQQRPALETTKKRKFWFSARQ